MPDATRHDSNKEKKKRAKCQVPESPQRIEAPSADETTEWRFLQVGASARRSNGECFSCLTARRVDDSH